MNYIDSFNKYVSTHKLKIGWHNSNANDQLKITISRNRDDGSKCDPLEALNELLMFVVVAVKEEGLKQQLPPYKNVLNRRESLYGEDMLLMWIFLL